jgi:hypothetical protein
MTKENQDFGIGSLIEKISKEYRRLEEEAKAEEATQREKLNALIMKEKKIKVDLAAAQEVSKKMETEYLAIEEKVESEKRAAIEETSLKEIDVKEGRVSLTDFFKRGRRKAEITRMTIEQSQKELADILKAVRGWNLEIMELEKALYQTQVDFRYVVTYPGRIMQTKLKGLKEYLDSQIGAFLYDMPQAASALEQINHKIQLTQGRSLSPGHTWEARPLKEAKKIIFSPIIPFELVSELKEKLTNMEEDRPIVVSYFLGRGTKPGPGTIDVDYSLLADRMAKTSKKEINKAELSTHEIDVTRR